MVGLLKSHGVHTFDELNLMLLHWQKVGQLRPALMSEVVEEFRAWKAPELDERTRWEMSSKLNAIKAGLGDELIASVDNVRVERFLAGVSGGWTRRNTYKWLKLLFKFSKPRRYILENPMEHIKGPKVEYKEPEVYSPANWKRMLDYAEQNDPLLLRYLAFSGFNFIRCCEMVGVLPNEPVLQWSDVTPTQITIRPPVAKKSKHNPKRFIPVQDATLAWIGDINQSGAVFPRKDQSFRKRMRKMFAETGVQPVKNGIRHSVISYFLAMKPETGVQMVAAWAGNSEGTIRAHYKSGRTPEEGEAWFDVRPS